MALSRVCGLLVVVALLVAQGAFAQDSPVFVRRSALTTPPVLDVEVLRQQRVEVPSLAILSDPQRSAVLQLDLFADVSFRAVRDRLEPTLHGISWVGKLDGYPESDAIFILVEDELIGHIFTPFGFFRIERQRDGGYLVQQVNQTPASVEDDVRVVPDADGSTTFSDRSSARDDRWSTRADDGSVIDILVAYTRKALQGFGSETRALATIDLLIGETNQAFANSRIPTRLRLVHKSLYEVPVGYEDKDALSVLFGRRTGSEEILAKRDYYAADLVAVIVEERPDACGWVIEHSNRGTITNGGVRGTPFSAVRRDCTRDGHSFAHEIGHNLGATHDWYVSGHVGWAHCPTDPICVEADKLCTGTGWCRDYAHGFVSLGGRFRDVMSYSNLCSDTRTQCQLLLRYSNPAILHNGRPTGVPAGTNVSCTSGSITNPDCDADVARMITELAPQVARYRHSLTALSARQLLPAASFRSASGRFRLTYQTDGNLVLYDDRDGVPLWTTNTGGTSPGQAVLQTDGNFVVYDRSGTVLWTSQTGGTPNAYLVVQDDGNLVIYDADGQPVWSRMQDAASTSRR